MKVFIVGKVNVEVRFIENAERYVGWTFIGVYDNEALAIKACISPSHFVGPAIINETLPDKIEDWKDAYYPIVEEESIGG